MKLVIIGVGGMGAISLSKTIAQMAINKNLSVKSSEIHGMAKKGGLVEVQMKIDEGLSGVVLQKEADIVILLEDLYIQYAKAFLNKNGILITLTKEEKESIKKEFGDIKFANSFILGRFIKKQSIFNKYDAAEVLKNIKFSEKNLRSFEGGVR